MLRKTGLLESLAVALTLLAPTHAGGQEVVCRALPDEEALKMRAGHRIGIVLAAILLLPVIATAGALLMGLPVHDKLFYFSVLWLLAWVACYLAARAVAWIIARIAGDGPRSK